MIQSRKVEIGPQLVDLPTRVYELFMILGFALGPLVRYFFPIDLT